MDIIEFSKLKSIKEILNLEEDFKLKYGKDAYCDMLNIIIKCLNGYNQ
jgi:hypothetical protein